MKTPRSDKAWKAFKHSSNAQHIRSESCRLETELDEVKAKLEKCRTALDEGFSVAKESLDYAEQTDDGASGLMARLRHFIALKETK